MFLFFIIFIQFLIILQSYGKLKDNYNPFNKFIDVTVDPCDNFYKFACGSWLKKNKLDQGEEYKSLFETANQKYLAFVEDAKKGVYDNDSPAIKKINQILKTCTSIKSKLGIKCSDFLIKGIEAYAFTSHFLSKQFIANDRNIHKYIIVNKMFYLLKEEFKKVLDEKAYIMDLKTKQLYEKKLEHMYIDVYTTNMLSNATMMEECFEHLIITEEDSEDLIVSRLLNFYNQLDGNKTAYLKHCSTFISNSYFSNTMASAHSFYMPEQNKIIISPMLLRKPFFNEDFPPSLLYGSIGFIVAHQIIQGFGTVGIFRDYKGKFTNEMTSEKALSNIFYLSNCFEKQYSSLTYNITNSRIDGTKTLDGNIADNGGIKLAYRVYLQAYESFVGEEKKFDGFRNYTDEQYFFMSFGKTFCEAITFKRAEKRLEKDVYSPYDIRVNKTLANFKPFSKAFGCRSGTKMNPVDKCELWRN